MTFPGVLVPFLVAHRLSLARTTMTLASLVVRIMHVQGGSMAWNSSMIRESLPWRRWRSSLVLLCR